MSNDGLILEYMDLSHIHLAVLQLVERTVKGWNFQRETNSPWFILTIHNYLITL